MLALQPMLLAFCPRALLQAGSEEAFANASRVAASAILEQVNASSQPGWMAPPCPAGYGIGHRSHCNGGCEGCLHYYIGDGDESGETEEAYSGELDLEDCKEKEVGSVGAAVVAAGGQEAHVVAEGGLPVGEVSVSGSSCAANQEDSEDCVDTDTGAKAIQEIDGTGDAGGAKATPQLAGRRPSGAPGAAEGKGRHDGDGSSGSAMSDHSVGVLDVCSGRPGHLVIDDGLNSCVDEGMIVGPVFWA